MTLDDNQDLPITSSVMAINPTQPDGDVDASVVAAGLGISLPSLHECLGFDGQSVPSDPAAAAFHLALQPVGRALEILDSFFHDSQAVKLWLRTPHPDLAGGTALDAILGGQAPAVCTILENALRGVPV